MSAKKIHRYHVVVTVMAASGIQYLEKIAKASSRERAIANARRELSKTHHILGVRADLIREKRKAKP
jgi:hypothetical protein